MTFIKNRLKRRYSQALYKLPCELKGLYIEIKIYLILTILKYLYIISPSVETQSYIICHIDYKKALTFGSPKNSHMPLGFVYLCVDTLLLSTVKNEHFKKLFTLVQAPFESFFFFSYSKHLTAVHRTRENYRGATAVCCSSPTTSDMWSSETSEPL